MFLALIFLQNKSIISKMVGHTVRDQLTCWPTDQLTADLLTFWSTVLRPTDIWPLTYQLLTCWLLTDDRLADRGQLTCCPAERVYKVGPHDSRSTVTVRSRTVRSKKSRSTTVRVTARYSKKTEGQHESYRIISVSFDACISKNKLRVLMIWIDNNNNNNYCCLVFLNVVELYFWCRSAIVIEGRYVLRSAS